MTQLTFTQIVPLTQDANGTVRVTGSRVTLDTIVSAFKRGNTAEQIQDSFPSLTLSQVYGVIAWYIDHQDEAERYLKERLTEADAIQQEIGNQPKYDELRETIRRRRALTHDANTIVGYANERTKQRLPMAGVIIFPDDLEIIVECATAEDLANQIQFLPW